eukprot:TRINITY_DN19359_c0_g1_i1.p1 TRINITY_DN19359_c0_g1~~TRINITY_DN19359_c0_g1_i1.p1  ORF type:complete len:667 (+),score=193.51 TRINITY_DN19359_c0_g1_i1:28-2001(+)
MDTEPAEMLPGEFEALTAHPIRTVIMKVRVCTPETYDDLKLELDEKLALGKSDLGMLLDQVEAEVERGLELARRRIETVKQQRAAEDERFARPKELLQQISDQFNSFEELTQRFREEVCPSEEDPMKAEKIEATEAEVKKFEEHYNEFNVTLKAFATEHGKDMLDTKLPLPIRTSWQSLVARMSEATKQAQFDMTLVKGAIGKVRAAAKQELFDAAKTRVQEKVKQRKEACSIVEIAQAVKEAEEKLNPFMRPKSRPEDEMLVLSTELTMDAESAMESLAAAKEQLTCADAVDEEDNLIKEDLKTFAFSQTKLERIKLGLLDMRIKRIQNIIANFKNDLEEEEKDKALAELTAPFIEKVNALPMDELVGQVNTAVKAAEDEVVDISKKKFGMTPSEITELAARIEATVQAAKDSLEDVRQQMCPADESLAEDLKAALRAAMPAAAQAAEIKLALMERKLSRVTNIVTVMRADLEKKKVAHSRIVRSVVLKLISLVREVQGNGKVPQSIEELFNSFETDKDGSVGEKQFLAFFADNVAKALAEKKGQLKMPSEEDLSLFYSSCKKKGGGLSLEDFKSFFSVHMQVVKVTAMTQKLSVAESEPVRDLRLGEDLLVLAGPEFDSSIKVNRVKVKAITDGAIGWATVAGNAGTMFLKEKAA